MSHSSANSSLRPASNQNRPLMELLEDRLIPSISAPDHLYTFTNDLTDLKGGPALISGGGSVGNGQYTFGANQGLRLENGLANPATYSVAMSLKVDSLAPNYKKLVDFQDRSADQGVYLTGGRLHLYPGTAGLNSVAANNYFQAVLTRDGATGSTSIYLNGVLQRTYTDVSNIVVPGTNVLAFFQDDNVTRGAEAATGAAEFIAIYNHALSASDVAELAAGSTTVGADQATVSVDEGSVATNTGTWNDADFDAVSLSASAGAVVQNADGTWSWSQNTTDGPSDSHVTITATDSDGNVANISFAVVVNNVAPTVSFTATQGSGSGQVSVAGTFADPGVSDTHSVTVDWGDGSAPETFTNVDQVANAFAGGHTYAEGGTYNIGVTVTDSDGASGSSSASIDVVIDTFTTGVHLVNGVLTIVGTDGKDFIDVDVRHRGCRRPDVYIVTVISALGDGRFSVHFYRFNVNEVDEIVIAGQGSKDWIHLDKKIKADVKIVDGAEDRVTRGHGFCFSRAGRFLRR